MNDETPICKGDAYLFADAQETETLAASLDSKGPFLMPNAKNTIYDYWFNLSPRNGSHSVEWSPTGYYSINVTRGDGKVETDGCIGVFIPCDADKKVVADDLRRRFGKGTILVKTQPVYPPDGNTSWLGQLKFKLKLPKSQFVSELITRCAEEFAAQMPKDDATRLKIYTEVCRKMSDDIFQVMPRILSS